jgi:hypothetical protein
LDEVVFILLHLAMNEVQTHKLGGDRQ